MDRRNALRLLRPTMDVLLAIAFARSFLGDATLQTGQGRDLAGAARHAGHYRLASGGRRTEHQRYVEAAEGEGVGHGVGHLLLAADVGHVVEIARSEERRVG